MKEGWEYKTLGECCDILDRLRKPIKQSKRESGNIPYYGATGLLDYVNDYIFDDTLVLLGEDGAKWGAGDDSAFIISGKTWVNNHAHVLKPYTFLNERYLVYYLKMSNLSDYITGVTVPKLNQEKMRQIIIPLTTLDEQRRIVSYLDSSFKLIDEVKNKALKSLTEAKALFQSALAEAMEPKEGWEEKTLKEVAKYRRGSFPQPYGKKEWYDGEGSMPFVQVADLQEDDFVLNDITKKRISKKAQEFSVFVKKGTVLVSLQGSIGKVAITQYDSYVDRTVAIFFKIDDFLNKYFFAIQIKLRFEIERVKARGTTIKTITKEEFSVFSINIPPLSTQKQIVSHLDKLSSKVRAIEEKYQKMVEECDALKQAMLRDVFE